MDLAELGWDAVWEGNFTAHRQGGLEPARVVHEDKLSYNVVGASGDRPAIITGRLRHLCPRDQDLPKVGEFELGKHWQLWMGSLIVLVVLIAPQGLMGLLRPRNSQDD